MGLKHPVYNALDLALPARRELVVLLLRVFNVHICLKVHLVQLDKLGLLDDLPDNKHEHHNGQLNVQADKVDGAKGRAEAAPALDEHKETVENDNEPWAIGICPVAERQKMRLALGLETGAEAKRRNANGDPAQLVRHTDNILQPRPQLAGANEAGAEAQNRNDAGAENRDPRHLVLVELAKHARCVAVHSKGIEQSRACKQGVVAGRNDTRQDDRVDDVGGRVGAGLFKDNSKW